jgi:WXG100 family type VII secretion target
MAADITSFGTVKVEPGILKEKAEDTYAKIRNFGDILNEMQQEAKSSSGYWVGEAGDAFRTSFLKKKQELDDILASFQDYPKRLLDYAGIYSEAISAVEAAVDTINDLKM